MQINFPIPGFIIPRLFKKLEGTNFHPVEKQDSANSAACSENSWGHFGRGIVCLESWKWIVRVEELVLRT